MKKASFTIPGEPQGKGRARSTRSGHHYTPEKTAAYETLIAYEYRRQCNGVYFGDAPIELDIVAYFGMPKSKKTRELALAGILLPEKKPDIDNVVKVVLDALNAVAYDDDSRVISIRARKEYAPTPMVAVRLVEIDPLEYCKAGGYDYASKN
jgi:Holliday junction resolvase RusA-like endonuclease